MDWSPEQVNELTRLWGEGLTTAEIGARLGLTKNQVIGKAHRLDLSKRAYPIKRIPFAQMTASQKLKSLRRRQWLARKRGELPPAPPKPKAAKVVKLHTRKERRVKVMFENRPLSKTQTCQHIAGDPKVDPAKCGQPAVEGKSYCPDHCAACYVVYQPTASERKAA